MHGAGGRPGFAEGSRRQQAQAALRGGAGRQQTGGSSGPRGGYRRASGGMERIACRRQGRLGGRAGLEPAACRAPSSNLSDAERELWNSVPNGMGRPQGARSVALTQGGERYSLDE